MQIYQSRLDCEATLGLALSISLCIFNTFSKCQSVIKNYFTVPAPVPVPAPAPVPAPSEGISFMPKLAIFFSVNGS